MAGFFTMPSTNSVSAASSSTSPRSTAWIGPSGLKKLRSRTLSPVWICRASSGQKPTGSVAFGFSAFDASSGASCTG